MIRSINLTVKRWDEREFAEGEQIWRQLLQQSVSDKLFLSWPWMYHWWTLWGKDLGSELYILAAYDEQEQLIGLAPLHISKDKTLGNTLPVTRLQFLGSRYRISNGIRCEYYEFIAINGFENVVNDAFFNYIYADPCWDELIVSDLVANSPTSIAHRDFAERHHCYRRNEIIDATFEIDCTGSFDDYLAALGKHSRLKLYNRRARLEQHGCISLQSIPRSSFSHFVDEINRFHLTRWSKPCFNEKRAIFATQMLEDTESAENTRCSLLQVDGRIISTIYCLKAGDRVYIIQTGFLESFDSKVSVGTLHMGYVIEQAFMDDSVRAIDLLAGEGKKSNYKTHYARPARNLDTHQIIRSPVLKHVYIFYDKIRGFIGKTPEQ